MLTTWGSILHPREKVKVWELQEPQLIRRPPKSRLKESSPYQLILINNPALEPLPWNTSPNPSRLGQTIFEGTSPLCSPLPGKEMKLSFSTSLKTLSLRFGLALVYRGQVFSISFSHIYFFSHNLSALGNPNPSSFVYLLLQNLLYMCTFNCVWLFCNPWTVTHQAPLSMELSKQEYWSGLPFPSPGDCLEPGIKATSCIGRWILYQLWHPPQFIGPC